MHESFWAVAASCINVHIICLCGHAEQEGRDERRGRSLFTTAKWLSPSHFNPHFALALCSLFVSPLFGFPFLTCCQSSFRCLSSIFCLIG